MKRLSVFALMVAMLFGLTFNAHALILSVSGDPSSLGADPKIIPAPSHILEDFITGMGMMGFDEAQGVKVSVNHSTDSGIVEKEIEVDSHMIFLNSPDDIYLSHWDVRWTFSGTILGVMSDPFGDLEVASTFELGSPFTEYYADFTGSGPAPPFPNRGIEGGDYYSFEPGSSELLVGLHVLSPGDWIRVITTAGPTPMSEPSTLILLGVGLAGLAGFGRKRIRKQKS